MANIFELKSIKAKLEQIYRNAVYLLYPLNKVNSLTENSCVEIVFDKYDNCISILMNSIMFMVSFFIILSGYYIPIFDKYKPFRSNLLKKIGSLICLGESFAIFELICIRIWAYFMIRQYQSVGNFQFVHLIKKLEYNDQKHILFRTKLIIFLINSNSYIFHTTMMILDVLNSDEIMQSIISLLSILGFGLLIRNGLRDVMMMFVYSLAGFKIVSAEIKQLTSQVNDFSSSVHQIAIMYENLATSILQLNSITKVLMKMSKLLVVPTFSCVIIVAITPVNDTFASVTRNIIVIAATIYSVRGYFLVAMMSIIASKSKVLFLNINSIIARGLCSNIEQIKRLNIILEDLSCSRCRIIARESTGQIDQMDLFNSIVSTASTVTLIFSLVESMNLF